MLGPACVLGCMDCCNEVERLILAAFSLGLALGRQVVDTCRSWRALLYADASIPTQSTSCLREYPQANERGGATRGSPLSRSRSRRQRRRCRSDVRLSVSRLPLFTTFYHKRIEPVDDAPLRSAGLEILRLESTVDGSDQSQTLVQEPSSTLRGNRKDHGIPTDRIVYWLQHVFRMSGL